MAQAAFETIGVVEGFYGPVWSEAERDDFVSALVPFGLNTYVYAPKAEPALGARLLEPLDKAAAQRLHRLHHLCKSRGIALWAGLHLEAPFDPAQREHLSALARKALQLAQVGVEGLALLWDDLPSARPARAGDPFRGSQAAAHAHSFRVLHDSVTKREPRVRWMVCPGRYSLDPMLERVHGAFEPEYLARLHATLPPEVPWLWTGPQVISQLVTVDDAEAYLAAAGIAREGDAGRRPILLWDNYPVNDGANAGRLNLAPVAGRGPHLPERVSGYLFNPLLQPSLGVLPAMTCLAYAGNPTGYAAGAAWQNALKAALPLELHEPVTELAALTRTGEGVGGAEVAAAGFAGNLPQRLLRAWDALSQGHPTEPYLLIDFRRLMNQLQKGLPPAMRDEAAPWLGRLWRALRLFETSADGAPQEVLAPLRAEFTEWREEAPMPEVLGPWFP